MRTTDNLENLKEIALTINCLQARLQDSKQSFKVWRDTQLELQALLQRHKELTQAIYGQPKALHPTNKVKIKVY